MDVNTLAERLNTIINNHIRRDHAKKGLGRYFDKPIITPDHLRDETMMEELKVLFKTVFGESNGPSRQSKKTGK